MLLNSRKPIDEMIQTFQKIRRMRMKPAHKVDEDRFDQEYLKEQRKLIIDAYCAIRTLRLILQIILERRRMWYPSGYSKGKFGLS